MPTAPLAAALAVALACPVHPGPERVPQPPVADQSTPSQGSATQAAQPAPQPPPPEDSARAASTTVSIVEEGVGADVADLRGTTLAEAVIRAKSLSFDAPPSERAFRQHSTVCIGTGDFRLEATVLFDESALRGAGIVFDGGAVVLDDPEWAAVLTGSLFGGGRFPLEAARPTSAQPGAPITVEVVRSNGMLTVALNGDIVGELGLKDIPIGRVGFELAGGAMRVLSARAEGDITSAPRPVALFTGADGDIDEYREPAIATDGRDVLVTAIAVSSNEDGSERTALHARRVDSEGKAGEARVIDLGDARPDRVALGYDGKRWQLLVQELAPRRLVKTLRRFESIDGVAFTEAARIESPDPLQIMPGAMLSMPGTDAGDAPSLRIGATVVRDGAPTAAFVVGTPDPVGAWSLQAAGTEPGCDPIAVDATRSVVRMPRTLERSVRGTGTSIGAAGYEGGPQTAALILNRGETVVLAQCDAIHPNVLRRMRSDDGGANWRRGATIWGGPAGNACAVLLDTPRHAVAEGSTSKPAETPNPVRGEAWIAFEGGDSARRQHVLLVRLPLAAE